MPPTPKGHFANVFSPDEDELIIGLKEESELTWSEIARLLPGRSKGSIQVRYSRRLQYREGGPQNQQASASPLFPVSKRKAAQQAQKHLIAQSEQCKRPYKGKHDDKLSQEKIRSDETKSSNPGDKERKSVDAPNDKAKSSNFGDKGSKSIDAPNDKAKPSKPGDKESRPADVSNDNKAKKVKKAQSKTSIENTKSKRSRGKPSTGKSLASATNLTASIDGGFRNIHHNPSRPAKQKAKGENLAAQNAAQLSIVSSEALDTAEVSTASTDRTFGNVLHNHDWPNKRKTKAQKEVTQKATRAAAVQNEIVRKHLPNRYDVGLPDAQKQGPSSYGEFWRTNPGFSSFDTRPLSTKEHPYESIIDFGSADGSGHTAAYGSTSTNDYFARNRDYVLDTRTLANPTDTSHVAPVSVPSFSLATLSLRHAYATRSAYGSTLTAEAAMGSPKMGHTPYLNKMSCGDMVELPKKRPSKIVNLGDSLLVDKSQELSGFKEEKLGIEQDSGKKRGSRVKDRIGRKARARDLRYDRGFKPAKLRKLLPKPEISKFVAPREIPDSIVQSVGTMEINPTDRPDTPPKKPVRIFGASSDADGQTALSSSFTLAKNEKPPGLPSTPSLPHVPRLPSLPSLPQPTAKQSKNASIRKAAEKGEKPVEKSNPDGWVRGRIGEGDYLKYPYQIPHIFRYPGPKRVTEYHAGSKSWRSRFVQPKDYPQDMGSARYSARPAAHRRPAFDTTMPYYEMEKELPIDKIYSFPESYIRAERRPTPPILAAHAQKEANDRSRGVDDLYQTPQSAADIIVAMKRRIFANSASATTAVASDAAAAIELPSTRPAPSLAPTTVNARHHPLPPAMEDRKVFLTSLPRLPEMAVPTYPVECVRPVRSESWAYHDDKITQRGIGPGGRVPGPRLRLSAAEIRKDFKEMGIVGVEDGKKQKTGGK